MIELDKRIIEGKKPLTALDTDVAKEFIGKQCYFADNIEDFFNLDNTNVLKGFLTDIDDDELISGCFKSNGIRSSFSSHFIMPCEWVKEEKKEPKFRSYTKDEFLNKFECGKPIIIRHKDDHINVFIETLSSVRIDNYMDNVYIRLYERVFDLKELFDEFEWQKSNGAWHPFGILEE